MTEARYPDGTVSRRRVVQGVLWTAPVVIVATSIPAAAASLPTGQGIVIYQATAARETAHGGDGVPPGTPAVTSAFRLRNAGKYDNPPTPAATLVSVAVIIPVGDLATPLWGAGGPGVGLALPAGWTLAGGAPSVSGGYATFSFTYSGDPGDDVGLDNIWVQTVAGDLPSQAVLFNSSAVHVGGDTSSDAAIRTL